MPFTILPNGHRIHYFDSAKGNEYLSEGNIPIIMIHGLGSSQNYYMLVIEQLEAHRCIAFDTYGAARSKSYGEKLSLNELAEDVVALMGNLGIPKAVIAGHSMGGPIACAIAARHPQKVAGIVCIGPVNPQSVKPEMFTQRMDTVLKDGMEPLANTIPTSATNQQSTTLQRAMIRELILNQDPKSYATHCQVIVDMKDQEPDWQSIHVPALVLAGEEDMSAPLEGCQAIHQKLGSPRKELKVMKGVGHWHCVEAGDQVGREIAAFCLIAAKA